MRSADTPTVPTHSGVVPYLRVGSELQTVVITNRRGWWIFPKGNIDPGRSPTECAAIEAHEEAGLEGEIVGGAIDRYWHSKGQGAVLTEMYLFRVTKVHDDWQESHRRSRRVLAVDAAREIVWSGLQPILDAAVAELPARE